jgi:putative salt-induced outer membrane protein YdiY
MKKLSARTRVLFAAAAIVVGGASAAYAQEDRVDAKVPFAFSVNGVQLPAGNYEVRDLSEGAGVLTIESTDGQKSASIMTIPSTSSNEEGDPKLLFNKINNQYVLVGIDYGNGEARQILSNTSNTSNGDQTVGTPAPGGTK